MYSVREMKLILSTTIVDMAPKGPRKRGYNRMCEAMIT